MGNTEPTKAHELPQPGAMEQAAADRGGGMDGLGLGADLHGVAERLRSLLFPPGRRTRRLRSLAAELGVSVPSLRSSIHQIGPRPSVEVAAAVVQHFGVDPTWLLTGKYDPKTHQQALADPATVVRLLCRTVLPRESPAAAITDGSGPICD